MEWFFWRTTVASWQAEASRQRRGSSGRDVFLAEFRKGACDEGNEGDAMRASAAEAKNLRFQIFLRK